MPVARPPKVGTSMMLDTVYAQMRWLEMHTGLSVFVGLCLEWDNKGVAWPKVVARLERRRSTGRTDIVHKYSAEYPTVDAKTMEALCLHLLYKLENMFNSPSGAE